VLVVDDDDSLAVALQIILFEEFSNGPVNATRNSTQPYSKRIAHRGIWVEPELLAEIEYRAKSAEGKVRHPFFKGLREDL
jgi:ATP-dependent DNA ligase